MKSFFELIDPKRYIPSNHKEIDEQQMKFITKGNSYLNAYNKKTHASIVEPTVLFLSDYARTHFITQEAFMEMYSYPDIEQHMLQHQDYVRDVAKDLKQLLSYKKSNDPAAFNTLSAMTAMLITDWFELHIMNADLRFNEFLRFEIRKTT